MKRRRHHHADRAVRARQVQLALGENAERVKLSAGGRAVRDAFLVGVETVRQAVLVLEVLLIDAERSGGRRIGEQARLLGLGLAAVWERSEWRDRSRQETPWRSAARCPKGDCPVPRRSRRCGRRKRRAGTPPGRSGPRAARAFPPPASRAWRRVSLSGQVPCARHVLRQRQEFVVGFAQAEHGGAGPDTRQLPQRVQRGIEPGLGALLQGQIGRVAAHGCLQRPHLGQRGVQCRREQRHDAVRQQRVQLAAANRQRRKLSERMGRRANRRAQGDDRERSAAIPRRRIPATATASRVPLPADCGPHHKGNAPRPAGGRSPGRGFAKRRCRHLQRRGLADRLAGRGPDRAAHRCGRAMPAPESAVALVPQTLRGWPGVPRKRPGVPRGPPGIPRRSLGCRTDGRRRTAPLREIGRPGPGNAHCRWPDRPLSAQGCRPGWGRRRDCKRRPADRASRAPKSARTHRACSTNQSPCVQFRHADRTDRRRCPACGRCCCRRRASSSSVLAPMSCTAVQSAGTTTSSFPRRSRIIGRLAMPGSNSSSAS